MQKIEQTLDSREVAEMVEKEHRQMLKDIRRYMKQFNEGKIPLVDFFKESTYVDAKGETRPCYRITKKGCEFIAHKLTGTKGTIFTARYINKFHEMEDIIKQQKTELKLPWFIRKFRGKYIIRERDFISIIGIDKRQYELFFKSAKFIGGLDYNKWGWKCDNEIFKQEYGFDYGDEDCMMYFYLCGALKALHILASDSKIKVQQGAVKLLQDGIEQVYGQKDTATEQLGSRSTEILERKGDAPILNFTITLGK